MRVAVVEDNEDLLNLATVVLRKAGYDVLPAMDGKMGAALILREHPDLVLLDLMLPERDGFEVLADLNAAGLTDRIPIIIVSALVGHDDRRRGLEAGAVEFLAKPYSPQRLVELAREFSLMTPEQLVQRREEALTALDAHGNGANPRAQDSRVGYAAGEHDAGQVLAGVLDLSVDAIVSVDAEQRVIGFNRGAELMFGFATSEILGQPLDVLLPVHLAEVHREHLRGFGRGSQAARHMGERREIHGRRKDGSLFPAEASILKNVVDGRLTFTAVLRDVSEREHLISQLRSRAGQQAAIAELGQRALSGAQLDAFLQDAARTIAQTLDVDFVQISRLTAGGLLVSGGYGWEPGVVGSAELGAGTRSHAGYVVAANQPVVVADLRGETRFQPSAQLVAHGIVSGCGVPVPGQRHHWGALTVYTAAARTFSEDDVHFVQAAANVIAGLVERNRVEAQLRTFLDAAPDATLVVDHGGRVVSANPQAVELLGFAVDELVGMTVEQLVPERFRQAHSALRAGYGQEPALRPMGADRELSVLRADGTEVPVDIMLNPLETEEGLLTVAAMRDVTDRRRMEAMREAFLRAVSHDLRTPLATLVGFADVLAEEDDLTDEQRHFVSRIVTNAQKLEGLLGDLLDLDRLSRGVLRPHRRHTDLRLLTERVVASMGEDAQYPIEVSVAPEAGLAAVDPAQVERILENLLINVRRHTPRGTPCRVTVVPNTEGVLLTVEDTGPGVPDHLKETIFHPFERGSGHDHSPGSGIGLSLVAQFAQLHDGRAWVEDAPGGGARFHVLLAGG